MIKELDAEALDFLYEKEINIDNDVIFYGVVKLTSTNASEIFRLLSTYENGVLFSSQGSIDPNFNLIVEELSELVLKQSESPTFHLDIVKSINLILDHQSEVFFPYAWEETGGYHLDIFFR